MADVGPADIDLLARLAQPGASYVSVAHDLAKSPGSLKIRAHRIYQQLGVHSLPQAIVALGVTKVTLRSFVSDRQDANVVSDPT